MKEKLKEKMHHLFYETSSRLLLFNSVLTMGIAALAVIITVEAILDYEQMGLLIMTVLLVYLIIMAVMGNLHSDKLPFVSGLIIFPLNLLVFPYLFLFAEGGGISSGMPVWFAFGIVLLFLVTEGRPFWILLVSTLVADCVCIVYSYYEQMPSDVSAAGFYYYEDNMIATICVGLTIGVALRYHQLLTENQRKQVQQAVVEAEQEKQRAEQADMVKSQLLASITHGIRTPMSTIIGMAELAGYDMEDKERVTDCLNKINASSQQLLYLVDNILDLSQLQVDELILREAPFNIEELIEKVRDAFIPFAQVKQVDFNVAYAGLQHKSVIGDAGRVGQIMMNLINNSINFTQEGGSVAVSIVQLDDVSEDYAKYALVVRDTGIGMSQEFLEKRLFSIFERDDNPYVKKVEGRGIGMSVVKGIADAMGAKIEIDSRLGEGTTVSIEFRLKIDELEKVYREENGSFMVNAIGKNILVVEDNDINMEIVQNILQRTKANVMGASDAEEALEILQASDEGFFDIIFMDIQLPGMDGYSAARTIRCMDREDTEHLPMIAMTANAFAQDIEKALNSGMNAHIAKPINIDDIYQKLYYYLYVIPKG